LSVPAIGLTAPGLAVTQDRVQPRRPRAGVNPRATATKPYGLMHLRGIFCSWQANHAHQPPSGGFVYVALGFSPGRGDDPGRTRKGDAPPRANAGMDKRISRCGDGYCAGINHAPTRAGINPRATATKPYGLTPLPGRFFGAGADHAPRPAKGLCARSPGLQPQAVNAAAKRQPTVVYLRVTWMDGG
jgi:hypothetical protein